MGTALGPPALAWLAAWILFVIRSGGGLGGAVDVRSWSRWDTHWYVDIAQRGYSASWRCSGHSLPPHTPRGHYLCGTVSWFPGYPALMRGVSEITTLSLPAAGLVVAWTCWYAYLAVGWQLLADARSQPTRWLCLALLTFAPGAIYFAAVFPISMTLAAVVSCLYFAHHSSWRWAPAAALVSGIVAGSGYVSAVVLGPALLIALLVAERERWPAIAAGAIGVGVGFGAVLLADLAYTGLWNGFFLAEHKYVVGSSHNPLYNVKTHLTALWDQPARGGPLKHAIAEQAAYTIGLLLFAVAVGLVMLARRRGRDVPTNGVHNASALRAQLAARMPAFDLTVLAAAVAAWLASYTASARISSWRSEAFVVVSVFLLRRVRWPLLVMPVVASSWVASTIAIYFFNYKLI